MLHDSKRSLCFIGWLTTNFEIWIKISISSFKKMHCDGSVQDCSISIAYACTGSTAVFQCAIDLKKLSAKCLSFCSVLNVLKWFLLENLFCWEKISSSQSWPQSLCSGCSPACPVICGCVACPSVCPRLSNGAPPCCSLRSIEMHKTLTLDSCPLTSPAPLPAGQPPSLAVPITQFPMKPPQLAVPTSMASLVSTAPSAQGAAMPLLGLTMGMGLPQTAQLGAVEVAGANRKPLHTPTTNATKLVAAAATIPQHMTRERQRFAPYWLHM